MSWYRACHFVSDLYGDPMSIYFRASSLRAALLRAYERGWSRVMLTTISSDITSLEDVSDQAGRRNWDNPELPQEQVRGRRAAAQAQLTAQGLAPHHIYPNRYKAPS